MTVVQSAKNELKRAVSTRKASKVDAAGEGGLKEGGQDSSELGAGRRPSRKEAKAAANPYTLPPTRSKIFIPKLPVAVPPEENATPKASFKGTARISGVYSGQQQVARPSLVPSSHPLDDLMEWERSSGEPSSPRRQLPSQARQSSYSIITVNESDGMGGGEVGFKPTPPALPHGEASFGAAKGRLSIQAGRMGSLDSISTGNRVSPTGRGSPLTQDNDSYGGSGLTSSSSLNSLPKVNMLGGVGSREPLPKTNAASSSTGGGGTLDGTGPFMRKGASLKQSRRFAPSLENYQQANGIALYESGDTTKALEASNAAARLAGTSLIMRQAEDSSSRGSNGGDKMALAGSVGPGADACSASQPADSRPSGTVSVRGSGTEASGSSTFGRSLAGRNGSNVPKGASGGLQAGADACQAVSSSGSAGARGSQEASTSGCEGGEGEGLGSSGIGQQRDGNGVLWGSAGVVAGASYLIADAGTTAGTTATGAHAGSGGGRPTGRGGGEVTDDVASTSHAAGQAGSMGGGFTPGLPSLSSEGLASCDSWKGALAGAQIPSKDASPGTASASLAGSADTPSTAGSTAVVGTRCVTGEGQDAEDTSIGSPASVLAGNSVPLPGVLLPGNSNSVTLPSIVGSSNAGGSAALLLELAQAYEPSQAKTTPSSNSTADANRVQAGPHGGHSSGHASPGSRRASSICSNWHVGSLSNGHSSSGQSNLLMKRRLSRSTDLAFPKGTFGQVAALAHGEDGWHTSLSSSSDQPLSQMHDSSQPPASGAGAAVPRMQLRRLGGGPGGLKASLGQISLPPISAQGISTSGAHRDSTMHNGQAPIELARLARTAGVTTGTSPLPAVREGKLAPVNLELSHQAVHIFFLMGLANLEAEVPDSVGGEGCVRKVPECGSREGGVRRVRLGELSTGEVVQHVIKPYTADIRGSFAQAAMNGHLRQLHVELCTDEGLFSEDTMTTGQAGKPAFGPATFFVSHSWNQPFGDLVQQLASHYDAQLIERGMLEVYYWLDILAIDQNMTSGVQCFKSPDSDMRALISSVQSVVLYIGPLSRPEAIHRLWCLYELLIGGQCPGVGVELLVNPIEKGSRNESIVERLQRFKSHVAARVNLSKALVTHAEDRVILLANIEKVVGTAKAIDIIQTILEDSIGDALVRQALRSGDGPASEALVKAGATLQSSSLILSGVKVVQDVVPAIGRLISYSELIRRIVLRRCGLSAAGVAAISKALTANCAVEELDLNDNAEIGDTGVVALASMLAGNPHPHKSLTQLRLSSCGMGDVGAIALGEALSKPNACLRELELGGNPEISSTSLSSLLGLLLTNTSLQTLSMSHMPAALKGSVPSLRELLKKSLSLTSLNLAGCGVGDIQMAGLAPGLIASVSLTNLNLGDNRLGLKSANILSAYITGSMKLRTLNIEGSIEIGDGVEMIAAAMPNSASLRSLNLSGVGMTGAGAKAIGAALMKCPKLEELDLSCNGDVMDGVMASVINMVRGHKQLSKINLSSCDLGPFSAAALQALIRPPYPPQICEIGVANCLDGLGPTVVAELRRWCRFRSQRGSTHGKLPSIWV